MEVLIESDLVDSQERPIPYWMEFVESDRILDAETQRDWLDDVEKRLREVVARIDPRPLIEGYAIERTGDAVTISTVTGAQVGKREIGLFSAGAWPCWDEILERVPEFQGTRVVFDAITRHEWLRRWDMRTQHDRACVEYGLF